MLVKLVSTVIRIRFQVNPATLLIPIYFSYMIGGGVPGTKVAPFLIDVRKNFHCPCSFSFSLLVIQKLQHMCAQSPTYPCALAHTCTYMHTHIPTAVPLECEMPEARSECCGEARPPNGRPKLHCIYTTTCVDDGARKNVWTVWTVFRDETRRWNSNQLWDHMMMHEAWLVPSWWSGGGPQTVFCDETRTLK